MQFLALATLTILLLTNFIQSVNFAAENQNSKPNSRISHNQQKFKHNSKDSVLGSYISTSSAETLNLKETENKKSESEITPTPTTKPAKSTPTSTPNTEPETNKTTENNIRISALGNAAILTNRINSYRQEQGLSPFLANETVCNFALVRVQELKSNFSHEGFRQRIDNNTLPYPDYSHIAENIADTDTPERAFELWRNSPGHNENMLYPSTFGCIGNIGRLYTLEIWEL